MTAPAEIGWHADQYDTSLASIRYRLTMPLEALQARGVPIERYDPARDPASYRAIIFSKSQSAEALAIARAARTAGRVVIYDLCDNLFAARAIGRASAARVDRVAAMLRLATHLTFSTATLAEQIRAAVDGLMAPVRVIPDVIDAEPATPAGPSAARAAARLDRFLARHPDALHCIWFGKSLGRAAGYVHLARAIAELERFAQRHPVTITVQSNDRLGYWRARSRWRVPACYVPWSLSTADAVIARHRVALIPVEINDYTAGKSINRPATALRNGLGVVADPIDSYRELAPFITLGNWQDGLDAYARWNGETAARIEQGARQIAARYGVEAIADRWQATLSAARESQQIGERTMLRDAAR